MAGIQVTKVWETRASATLEKINKKVTDNIFKGVPILEFMLQNGRVRRVSGGLEIGEPVMYGTNPNFQAYTYYDSVAIAPTDEVTTAFYPWRLYNQAITISEHEVDVNSDSETKIFDLLKTKIKNAEMSMRTGLETDFFAAQSGKRLDGLGTIINTSAGTVGKINESTEAWWAPSRVTSGVTALNLRKTMRTMRNNILDGVPDAETKQLVIFTTQTIHEAYEDLLQDLVRLRYEDQSKRDAGFGFPGFQNALSLSGIPIVWSSRTPANTMYFLNTAFLGFVLHTNKDFKMTEMRHEVNKHASVAHIQFMGNLTCSARRHQGIISSISV